MSSVFSLLKWVGLQWDAGKERLSYEIRPLKGLFYVEYVSGKGDIREQRIEAKHLVEKDGEFYLYGWCEKLPRFHSLPVEQITILADHETGEVIPREDVVLWLKKRLVH